MSNQQTVDQKGLVIIVDYPFNPVPVIIIFIIAQRSFIEGIRLTGLNG